MTEATNGTPVAEKPKKKRRSRKAGKPKPKAVKKVKVKAEALTKILTAIAKDGITGVLSAKGGLHIITLKGTYVASVFKKNEGIDIKAKGKLLVRLMVVYPLAK